MRAQPATFDTSVTESLGSSDPSEPQAQAGPVAGSCRDLLEGLQQVVDPRKRRGIRHQLVSILALAAATVVAGARSSVAVGQWTANAPNAVLTTPRVRLDPRTGGFMVPHESTIRRVLQACDGDRLDEVLGAWLYPRLPPEQLVVDGKTVRGSRAGDRRAVHRLAAMLTGSRAVVTQRQIAAKTNESTTFAPLFEGPDLTGTLVSANALHTQRAHARYLVEEPGHRQLFVDRTVPSAYSAGAVVAGGAGVT